MSSKEDSDPDNVADSTNSKDAMFDPKPKSKTIRVLTVLAYVLSVSMAAILLSIYYIFMWDGRPHFGSRAGNVREIGAVETINESFLLTTLPYATAEPSEPSVEPAYHLDENKTREDDIILDRTINETDVRNKRTLDQSEMQQQFTAQRTEILTSHFSTSSPPTSTTANHETATFPEEYDSLEELGKSSILVGKLMDVENYEEKWK